MAQPYAITEDGAYAVIYQTSKYSILEEVEIDEETNTLTVYTGKQKMEDSFVAYEYQSFDVVQFNSD
ncbi:MAG: hypothetical protein LUF28_08810 [Clostridiales bacterium]|nr:hypothetical protein [Clostridiales bacterium]